MKSHGPFQILLKRYQSNELAHFYTIDYGHSSHAPDHSFLTKEVDQFLNNLFKEHQLTFNSYHQDILHINREISDDGVLANFGPDDHREIEKFQRHGSSQLKLKLCFFYNPGSLSDTHANKLLKTLEEPDTPTCFIFLKGHSTPLLPTLQSRTIRLRGIMTQEKRAPISGKQRTFKEWITHKNKQDDKILDCLLADDGLNKKIEFLKTVENSDKVLLEYLSQWVIEEFNDHKIFKGLTQLAHQVDLSNKFRNNKSARLHLLTEFSLSPAQLPPLT